MADAKNETIDLTGDSDVTLSATSEDDDLHRAIAMSLQSMPTSSPVGSKESTPGGSDCSKPELPAESTTLGMGILGIDRKRQEEERLARLKRKRESTVSSPSVKQDLGCQNAIQAHPTDNTEASMAKTSDIHNQKETGNSSSTPTSHLQYPHGVVKKTWAFGFERANDIKLEEVLQPSHLDAAMISSFQWDWNWLLPKLDTQRTKFVFVIHAKDEETRKKSRTDFDGAPNVRLCFPPIEGQIGCMHSKLMLLFYPTYLRVVIPTANLMPFDWGEPFQGLQGGVMENTVFLIDLPRRVSETCEHENADVPFFQSLQYFLKAMKLQEDVLAKLLSYDFSKLAQHGFVHSIAGSHYGDSWRETGACGLGQFLHKMGLRTFDTIEIDFVTSSVGSLNDEFLRSLYLIAQGDSGLAEYTFRNTKSVPLSVSQDLERRLGKEFPSGWKQHFRFYYPSDATVHASDGGPSCGGTICLNARWWAGSKFPRSLIRDCQSRRRGMLMHNKVSQTSYPIALRD